MYNVLMEVVDLELAQGKPDTSDSINNIYIHNLIDFSVVIHVFVAQILST